MSLSVAVKEKNRAYYLANREKVLANTHAYYFAHKERASELAKAWRARNAERISARKKIVALIPKTAEQIKRRKEYQAKYLANNKLACSERSRMWYINLRESVLNAYGRKCICCGESREQFLTIEHTNGDGAKHRKEVRRRVYLDLKRRGFPKDGFALMCMNCNWASRGARICPHKLEVLSCMSA